MRLDKFVIYIFFFKKKAENNRLKKPVGQNVEIYFFFVFV